MSNVSQEEFIGEVVKDFKAHGWQVMERVNDIPMIDYESAERFLVEKFTLALQHGEAIGREKCIADVKDISDREIEGQWLPDGMHAYHDRDLEALHTKV